MASVGQGRFLRDSSVATGTGIMGLLKRRSLLLVVEEEPNIDSVRFMMR